MTEVEPNVKNVFVYGTLQQGESRNYVLAGLDFKKAILPGFKKIEPKNLNFPFIIRKDDSEVIGEVYFNVGNDLLTLLDRIEGEGSLYHRIIVEVEIDSGQRVKAFTYYPDEVLIINYTS